MTWFILGGRGSGKTRAGAEWVRHLVEGRTPLTAGKYRQIALVGETILAVREVMIEGPSGLRSIAARDMRPDFIASRQLLVWPNGARAQVFSAHHPDKLRGPQFDAAWCDELCKWRYDELCWDMLQFGLRLGKTPRQVVTTTPRPSALVKKLMADPTCHVTRVSTMANKANLAPGFMEALLARYAGTRLGRQEIDAELVEDVTGALWTYELISENRVENKPDLSCVIIAVDPPSITGPKADACGICVLGADDQEHAYILADETVRGLSPAGWAKKIIDLYRYYKADRLIAEINQGGDLVREIIIRQAPYIKYRAVRATRAKLVRAEPVAALYERGRVHHVGVFSKLEQEMYRYNGRGKKSPDRMDALVWGVTDLLLHSTPQAKPAIRRI